MKKFNCLLHSCTNLCKGLIMLKKLTLNCALSEYEHLCYIITEMNKLIKAINAQNVLICDFIAMMNKIIEEIKNELTRINEEIELIKLKDDEQDQRLDGIDILIISIQQAISDINDEIDLINQKNQEQDDRLDGVDNRLDGVDNRLNNIDVEIVNIYNKIDILEIGIQNLNTIVNEHGILINQIIDQLENMPSFEKFIESQENLYNSPNFIDPSDFVEFNEQKNNGVGGVILYKKRDGEDIYVAGTRLDLSYDTIENLDRDQLIILFMNFSGNNRPIAYGIEDVMIRLTTDNETINEWSEVYMISGDNISYGNLPSPLSAEQLEQIGVWTVSNNATSTISIGDDGKGVVGYLCFEIPANSGNVNITMLKRNYQNIAYNGVPRQLIDRDGRHIYPFIPLKNDDVFRLTSEGYATDYDKLIEKLEIDDIENSLNTLWTGYNGTVDIINDHGRDINANRIAIEELLPIPITENSDLNDYTESGNYYVATSATAGTIANTPYSSTGFALCVIRTGTNLRTQIMYCGSPVMHYIKTRALQYSSGVWNYGEWIDLPVMRNVPPNKTASGSKGQMAVDSDYLYVCTATNTWVRFEKDGTW